MKLGLVLIWSGSVWFWFLVRFDYFGCRFDFDVESIATAKGSKEDKIAEVVDNINILILQL